jgi:hypothetical protein
VRTVCLFSLRKLDYLSPGCVELFVLGCFFGAEFELFAGCVPESTRKVGKVFLRPCAYFCVSKSPERVDLDDC